MESYRLMVRHTGFVGRDVSAHSHAEGWNRVLGLAGQAVHIVVAVAVAGVTA
jgi:hypothetical protein